MQKLKSEGYTKPIVVITGNTGEENREKYLTAGFDDFLEKPLNDIELERVLEKFF